MGEQAVDELRRNMLLDHFLEIISIQASLYFSTSSFKSNMFAYLAHLEYLGCRDLYRQLNLKMKKQKQQFRYSLTIWILPLLLLILLVAANYPSANFATSTRRAIGFALLASVVLGCLFLADGLIHRPNKYLWKAITAISMFYLATVVFLFFLDKQSAINVIQTYFDPSLKLIDYEQISYGQDCRLFAPQKQNPFSNISHSFFDLFAVAHFLGWFFKTLICRDLKLLLLASVTFEVIEFSLRDVLNNFKECWWDHILVDALGCNLLGILIGFYFIDHFKLERYKWSLRGTPFKHTLPHNLRYFWTRWDVSAIEAQAFGSLKKYIQVAYFIVLIQVNDLSLFFLKYIYGIPPSNFMCIGRVFIIGLLSVNAAKEYFKFVTHHERRLRINCFLVNFIVYTEVFIVLKHGINDFEHAYIAPWGKLCLGLLLFTFLLFLGKLLISDILRLKNGKTLKHRVDEGEEERRAVRKQE